MAHPVVFLVVNVDETASDEAGEARVSSSLGELSRETLIYGVSVAFSRSLALLMLPLYLHALEPEEFGVASLITAASMATAIVVSLGLYSAIVRWYWLVTDGGMDDRKRTVATAVWCELLAALALACLVLLFAGPIAHAATADSGNAAYFRLVALGIPLAVFDANLRTWLRLQRRPGTTVVYTAGTALAALGLAGVLVGILHMGLLGVFGATLLAQLVAAVAAVTLMRSWLSPWYCDRRRALDMLSYSWPRIPGDVAYWVLDLSDRFIIRYYWSGAEVGKYQMATTLAAATSLAVQAFQQAWLPFALSINERPGSEKVYARALPVYLAVVGTMAIITAACVRDAISLVAPPLYLTATTAAGILAAGYMVRGAGIVASTGTVIGGSQTGAVGALFVAAGVNVGLNFAIVPRFGITGAAISTLVACAVALALTFRVANRLHPIPFRYGPASVLILAAVAITWIRAATASSFGLRDLGLDAAAFGAFAIVLVTTRVVSVRDLVRWLASVSRPRPV